MAPYTPPPLDPNDPASVLTSIQMMMQSLEELRREWRTELRTMRTESQEETKNLRKELRDISDSLHNLPFATERECEARHLRVNGSVSVERDRIARLEADVDKLQRLETAVLGIQGKGGLANQVDAMAVEVKSHTTNWAKLMGFVAAGALGGGSVAVGLMKLFGMQ